MALSPSSALVKYAPIVLGYFMADNVNTPIDTAVGGKVDSKIIAAGEVGLGYLLAFKGKKSTIKSVAGGILIGAGLKRGLKDFGVISGYGKVPIIGSYGKVPVIGGYTGGYTPSTMLAGALNGNAGSGYRVPNARNVVGGCGDDDNGSDINCDSRN
jgi:hypothetical protein